MLAAGLPAKREVVWPRQSRSLIDNKSRANLQHIMSMKVGVLRSATSMRNALDELVPMQSHITDDACTENWEMTNLHTVACALTMAAMEREETRGSHWREDFPLMSPNWLKRIVITADSDGKLIENFEPVMQVPDTKEVL